ncbi:hypothetical protein JTB14_036045 [Gonioctena quinquepunctata]|nr:hypothetical protein JTB14_036045 [Gonioctena quinquepunctata]
MKSSLEYLQASSTIVADTADFEAIKKFIVTDATTNPSIILQAATLSRYNDILKEAVEIGRRVHVQVDARLSFDKERIVDRALKTVRFFAKEGISKEMFMIKIPATWEGIQAAKELEQKYGVNCNQTTMFTVVQAVACAEAGVTCIAPFVGRIQQWYVDNKDNSSSSDEHRGVATLKSIHEYFKENGYETKIMGAYFLNVEEIKAVAGCDLLTIPLELLEELATSTDAIPKKLDRKSSSKITRQKIDVSESNFRWMMNENQMATDLLSETIRKFAADCVELENVIREVIKST